MTGTRLFSVYNTMKERCYNPSNHKYYRYGARGIKVCDEWLCNPKSFFDWAQNNGYKEGLTIDRINNDGDYCPNNCRWSNAITQGNNKSNNVKYEYNGTTKTIREWADSLGISYAAVKSRIARGTFDQLFNVKSANTHLVTYSDVTMSVKEWADFLDMNYTAVRSRVQRGNFDKLFPKDKEDKLQELKLFQN